VQAPVLAADNHRIKGTKIDAELTSFGSLSVRDASPSATLKPIEAEVLLLSDSSPVNIPLRHPLVR
jgi:hypothetical protein